MTALGKTIPKGAVDQLRFRADRLCAMIDGATHKSSNKALRVAGAQFIERVQEWLQAIQQAQELTSDEGLEIINSFLLRLRLAEDKVKTWNIAEPPAYRAHKSTTPKRRRRKRRSKVATAA